MTNITSCLIGVLILFYKVNGLTFTSLADDEHWVYVDGVEVGHGFLSLPITVTVPDNTKLIAVKAVDYNNYAGFIGSLSNGVVTDGSWKCTRDLVTDWEKLNFDDSKWSAPTTTRANGDPQARGVASSAKWIWAGAYNDAKTTVYCRKSFGEICI